MHYDPAEFFNSGQVLFELDLGSHRDGFPGLQVPIGLSDGSAGDMGGFVRRANNKRLLPIVQEHSAVERV